MNNFMADIRESAREIKNVRSLTGGAMLIALDLILNYTRIVISSFMEISFAFLAVAVSGMLYGPVMAGIMVAVADIIGFFVSPNGFFLPRIYIKCFSLGLYVWTVFLQKENYVQESACCINMQYNFIQLYPYTNVA